MTHRLFARKPVSALLAEASDTEHGLKRALGPLNLVTLGIGAIIGAGIFVLTGNAASQYAGPAVVFSFILAGVGCAFAGLCYAEMVAMIPVAGSAYTYAYATLGELVAWIIGWDLILEYSVGTVAVSVGWSGFFVALLKDLGINFPAALSAARGTVLIDVPGQGWEQATEQVVATLMASGIDPATLPHGAAFLNVPAILVVAAVTTLLVIGVRESANVNSAIVILKVGALLAFITAGIAFLLRHPDVLKANWSDFVPDNKGTFGAFGWSGVLRGAGVIFFAYIGFAATRRGARKAKNPSPERRMAILGAWWSARSSISWLAASSPAWS